MKKRYSTAIGFAVAALLALSISGCSSAILAETKAGGSSGKVSVTLSLPAVSPVMAKALNQAGSAGSRALLFLNSYSVSIYDQTTMSYTYSDMQYPAINGPGNSQEYKVDLVPGRTYDIYVYGTNTTENAYGTTVMGVAYDQYISAPTTGGNDIWISLKPYNPVNLGNGDGSNASESIVKSVYLPGATPQDQGTFTKLGGEKWYAVTPDSNVLKVAVTPKNGFVYVALFDSEGMFLTAGVSPGFMVEGTTLDVNLEAGVTAGRPVYIGLVDIVTADPAPGEEKDDVTVTILTSNLADDDFDYWGNDTLSSAGYVSAPAQFTPNVISKLKAYDRDYYYFYADAKGTYTVQVTNTDPSFGSGYTGDVSLSGLSGYAYDSSYNYTDGKDSPKDVFFVSLVVSDPGYYYVDVGLRSFDPQFNFPVLAGEYELELSFLP